MTNCHLTHAADRFFHKKTTRLAAVTFAMSIVAAVPATSVAGTELEQIPGPAVRMDAAMVKRLLALQYPVLRTADQATAAPQLVPAMNEASQSPGVGQAPATQPRPSF